MITGQVFFRETGAVAPTRDGRRLVSFVGIIAVADDFTFADEHQYVVTGGDDGTRLAIHPSTGIDRTELAAGLSTGQLLKEPIWRC